MKNKYTGMAIRWGLAVVWLLSLTLSAPAQTTTPPVLQWQRALEGDVNFNSTIYAAKSTTGEFGVLTGTTLTRLTASGAVKGSGLIEGSVVLSTTPLTYSTALRTSGLIATPDGSFLVQANDEANLYLIKKDANGNRVWSKVINPIIAGARPGLNGLDLIQTADGGYVSSIGYSELDGRGYMVAVKLDQDGNFVWIRFLGALGSPSINGLPPANNPTYRRLALPDGGFIQIGATDNLSPGNFSSSATMTRLDAQGNVVTARRYSTTIFRDIISNPDGSGSFIVTTGDGDRFALILPNGDLVSTLVGPQFSPAPHFPPTPIMASDGTGQPFFVTLATAFTSNSDFLLRGYDQQNQVVWTRRLGGSGTDSPQTVLATGDGYLLVGTTNSTDGDVQGKQGNALATWVVKLAKTATGLALTQPTYNCQTGAITFNTTGGDGSTITYSAPGISRSSATSNSGTVEPGLRGDPKVIPITATQNGITVTYSFDLKAFCSGTPPPIDPPTPPTPPTGGTLALTQPTYNCQTGAITFNTTGGDGSTITYNAPGIMRSSATSNSGTVEPGLRGDPKPILITATQSGQTVSYTFDFGAFCTGTPPPVNPPTPPTGAALTLLAPTYDCVSGAFTFRTSGGNGSSIEYRAVPGITDWTSNPNQFVDKDSRTANDVKPFTLMARQNGVMVSYEWDLKAACGRSQARLGAGEREARLSVSVLGNPVEGNSAEIEIRGAVNQAVQVDLIDLQGRVLHRHFINQAGSAERVRVPIGNGTGLFLLNVSTATQRQEVKLLKL
ncbi:T9SS type A sorting domain-containing protein [Spirosoma arcticum]